MGIKFTQANLGGKVQAPRNFFTLSKKLHLLFSKLNESEKLKYSVIFKIILISYVLLLTWVRVDCALHAVNNFGYIARLVSLILRYKKGGGRKATAPI